MSNDMEYMGTVRFTPSLTDAQLEEVEQMFDDEGWENSVDSNGVHTDIDEGTDDFLHSLIEYLKPMGIMLNGQIEWHGEDFGDNGIIYVKDSVSEQVEDVNPGPSWAPRNLTPTQPAPEAPAEKTVAF